MRPAPTSTLFPYTTLFRSGRVRSRVQQVLLLALRDVHQRRLGFPATSLLHVERVRGQRDRRQDGHDRDGDHELRSEEHTSELQSLTNLVCRLLPEKTKNPE